MHNEQWPTALARDAMALLWPVACIGCGRPDREWCGACAAAFEGSHGLVRVAPGSEHARHSEWIAAGPYEGTRKDLLVRVKHGEQLRFVRPLGRALVGPLCEVLARCRGEALIVAMPSRGSAVRRRGYRPLELMLREALGDPRLGAYSSWAAARELRRSRVLVAGPGRTGQVGLGVAERRENAARLRVRRGSLLEGRDVVLVDDIVTSGATLSAAARVLQEHGARVVGAAVVAVTVRRSEAISELGGANEKLCSQSPEERGNV